MIVHDTASLMPASTVTVEHKFQSTPCNDLQYFHNSNDKATNCSVHLRSNSSKSIVTLKTKDHGIPEVLILPMLRRDGHGNVAG